MKFPTDSELKRAVTIRKAFFDLTQDINAAILLSQLDYWSKRTSNQGRWVYKTQKELQEEIFLTPYQQRRARVLLVTLNLIEEKCIGLPKKMYFRIKRGSNEQNEDHIEVKKKHNKNQNNTSMYDEELSPNDEETSSTEIEKLDHKDKQTSSFTNIEEITTKNTSKITTVSNDVCSRNADQIVFEHWKFTMKHANAKKDKNRTKLIKDALKLGYSIEELCQAISGCAITPHNIGLNDKGQRYDGLHIILRNADQIDRFISNFLHPPRQKTKSDQLVQDNINVAEKWLLATERETSNGQY